MDAFLQIAQTLALAAVLIAMGIKMALDMKKFRKHDMIPIRPGRLAASAGLVLFGLYFCYQSVLLGLSNPLVKMLKLASWNVNGIRAVAKKGFFEWIGLEKPDIVCLQETKISADKLSDEIKNLPGYRSHWSHAERKGYSGVAIFSKEDPLTVKEGLGIAHFDSEGRVLEAEYADFTLLNIYYPNGKSGPERLQYKLDFYDAFLDRVTALRAAGKRLVICGDFNTAHKPIDLARPKPNETTSGFLPEERAWMDKFVSHGYLDTFRIFNEEPHNYTWWDMVTRARERNVGWRIDYFFASDDLKSKLNKATIEQHVTGSDHCPVTLELAF